MPNWNPNRHPDMYSAFWHEVVRAAPGTYVLDQSDDLARLKHLRRRFNSMRASLRQHPQHPSARVLATQDVVTSIERVQDTPLHCLKVVKKPKLDLEAILSAAISREDMQPKD